MHVYSHRSTEIVNLGHRRADELAPQAVLVYMGIPPTCTIPAQPEYEFLGPRRLSGKVPDTACKGRCLSTRSHGIFR